jgi:L-rhamnose mutarotase
MVHKAFVMQLHPGKEEEYRRRHDEIWPELEDVLQNADVRKYSIFLHPQTLQLFAYVEVLTEEKWEEIANTEVCQRWWEHMRDLMETNPDSSPKTVVLDEVFRLAPGIPF